MKRIALAYWLEQGKTGLNKLQENSLEIIPSQRTVEHIFSYLRFGDDMHCPSYCAQFHDMLKSCGELQEGGTQVQIMFDEIKLKSGVWFNVGTNVVHGFAASKNGKIVSLAEEILSIAEDCISEELTNLNDTENHRCFK